MDKQMRAAYEGGKLVAKAMRRIGFFMSPGRNPKYDKRLSEEISKLKRPKKSKSR